MANAVLYKRMSDLQKPILDETNQARYINQNFAYIISIFANLLVFAADVAIAKAMTTRIRGAEIGGAQILVAPVTLAATAGFLALIVAFADISQLRGLHVQERRQGNIIVMDTSTDNYRDETESDMGPVH
ncbi:hypothetical protein MMC22_001772 [Lobaria immixta]|nr:hypothetical protein [Lobaria immixta]